MFDGEHGTDLATLAVADHGDWDLAGLDREEIPRAIGRRVPEIPEGAVAVFVGGDNAITRPLAAGVAGGDLERIGLLILDPHHDVRTFADGPTSVNHLRGLVDDGLLDGRVVQIGVHPFGNSGEQRAFFSDHGFEIVTMEVVDEVGAPWVVASALNDLAERCDRVYVDVDLAVLDAVFSPGCPGSRPGGMHPRQLAAAVREAGRHPSVAAIDFVEVDPTRDPMGVTVMNLANAFLSFSGGLAMREAA